MRRFCLYLFTLACAAGQTSGPIHGVVVDPSGRPVEGARMQCGGRSVFTNIEGRYALALSEPCEATIEKAGFKSTTLKLSTKAEGRIMLTVQGPSESVIVSATRASATPEQAAVAANVVDSAQLEARGHPQIQDVLRELPGLAVVSNGRPGDQTSLFTRGASSTSTLVLLDGVPLNDPGGQINVAHLSSTGVDRIEVVRGPESVLFGAEASAGVVQIFTRRGDSDDSIPHGFFEYERGNFQTDRGIASLSGGLAGRFDYAMNADQFHSAGMFPNDFYRNTTGSANLGFRISDATQVRGTFHIYDAHLGTPGQVAYQAFDTVANQETCDATVSARLDDSRGSRYFQTFSFGYNRLHDQFNEEEPFRSQDLAALVRGNTYFVSLLNPAALPSQPPAGTRIATGTAYFGPFGSLNLTERKTVGYQGTLAQSGGTLVFGYDFQDQSGVVSDTNATRQHHGLFINEQYRLGDRVYFSAGVRAEHSSVFGTEFVPRGGVGVRVLPATFLRVSAGRGITEPSLYENFVRSSFAMGNPLLKPEKTNTYEAGIVRDWWGRRFRTEVSAFRSSFHDLITYVYPTWANIERSWARGLEFSAEARITSDILLSGNYTRLYTRIVNSVNPSDPVTGIGQELLRRPRNSGAVILAVTPRRWTLIVGARFVGDRHDSDYLFGVTRNSSYENVYLSASFNLKKHFTPVLRIDNLLNERYEEALGFTALSRSVLAGLRVGW